MAIYQKTPPLPHNMPLVDPKTGAPTIEFQRYWQQLFQNAEFTLGEVDGKVPLTRQINTTAPIAGGGSLENDLTLSHNNSGVTADTYGDATHVAQFTVDAKGHVTNATEVAISGGGGSSNERARVVPLVAGYTLQNPGTTTIADKTFGMDMTGPAVGTQARFVRKNGASPAAPYAIIARANPVLPIQGGGYFNSIILRDSGSGKIIISGIYNGTNYLVQNWNAYNSFNSDILGPQNWPWLTTTPWQRLRNDGTNLYWDLSPDGDDWRQVATTTIAGFIGTIDEIGFGIMLNGNDVQAIQQSFEVV